MSCMYIVCMLIAPVREKVLSKQRFTILLFLKAQAGPDLSSFCAGGRPQNFNEDNERGKRIHFHP